MGLDYQIGELVDHSLLNPGVDCHGYRHRYAIRLTVCFSPRARLDHQLLVAKRTADALLALTDPSPLGPLDLVELVGFGRPFRQFLECG